MCDSSSCAVACVYCQGKVLPAGAQAEGDQAFPLLRLPSGQLQQVFGLSDRLCLRILAVWLSALVPPSSGVFKC